MAHDELQETLEELQRRFKRVVGTSVRIKNTVIVQFWSARPLTTASVGRDKNIPRVAAVSSACERLNQTLVDSTGKKEDRFVKQKVADMQCDLEIL